MPRNSYMANNLFELVPTLDAMKPPRSHTHKTRGVQPRKAAAAAVSAACLCVLGVHVLRRQHNGMSSTIAINSNGLRPTKAIEMSHKPRVFFYERFLSDEQADWLVQRAEARLKPSKTFGGGNGARNDDVRRSSETTFTMEEHARLAVLRQVTAKISAEAKLPAEHFEELQVQRYRAPELTEEGKPEFYWPHMDSIEHERGNPGGRRVATMILFLSDVDEGGETFFSFARNRSARNATAAAHLAPHVVLPPDGTKLDEAQTTFIAEARHRGEGGAPPVCATSNDAWLKFRPRKGAAVLFYTVEPSGELDPLALHGGCPVLRGTKYISQQWIREHPMQRMAASAHALAIFPLTSRHEEAHLPQEAHLPRPRSGGWGGLGAEGGRTCSLDLAGREALCTGTAPASAPNSAPPSASTPASVQTSASLSAPTSKALCTRADWPALRSFDLSGVVTIGALVAVPYSAASAEAVVAAISLITPQGHTFQLAVTPTSASLFSSVAASASSSTSRGASVLRAPWQRTRGGDPSSLVHGAVLLVASIHAIDPWAKPPGSKGRIELRVGGEPRQARATSDDARRSASLPSPRCPRCCSSRVGVVPIVADEGLLCGDRVGRARRCRRAVARAGATVRGGLARRVGEHGASLRPRARAGRVGVDAYVHRARGRPGEGAGEDHWGEDHSLRGHGGGRAA